MKAAYTPSPELEPIDDESDDHQREMMKIVAHGCSKKDMKVMANWISFHTEFEWERVAAEIGMPSETYRKLDAMLEAFLEHLFDLSPDRSPAIRIPRSRQG
jgi:hypothetical protein